MAVYRPNTQSLFSKMTLTISPEENFMWEYLKQRYSFSLSHETCAQIERYFFEKHLRPYPDNSKVLELSEETKKKLEVVCELLDISKVDFVEKQISEAYYQYIDNYFF